MTATALPPLSATSFTAPVLKLDRAAPTTDVIGVEELAALLNRPLKTVYRWVKQRTLYVDRDKLSLVPREKATSGNRGRFIELVPEWGGIREQGIGEWAFSRAAVAAYTMDPHSHVLGALERFHARFAQDGIGIQRKVRRL